MDIRYFAFLERLKQRHDSEDTCLCGEMVNHTRPLTDELGVRIPPGALEICETLPAVDIPERICLFDRIALRNETREWAQREEEWLRKAVETCETAERQLAQYHQRLCDDANECLRLAKENLTKEKKL